MANRVCPKCKEEYSTTYRKCPFCEEREAIARGRRLRRGGKRSAKRRNTGGAFGVMMLLAVVVIAGVLGYVFFGDQVADFMGIRRDDSPQSGQTDLDDSQQGGQTGPDASGQQDGQTGPDVGGQQIGQTGPGDGQQSGQTGPDDSENPPQNEPTPLTLVSPAEFTIPAGETGRVSVSGGSGEITWTSSNPEIASVDGGAVTGVAGGTVTITASAGEESVSCKVTVTGDPWVSPVTFKLNKTDITINDKWPDPVQLKIQGGDYDSAEWSSSNTGAATVSATGVVTRVGKGTVTITCVVDGQTLTCIVRCG